MEVLFENPLIGMVVVGRERKAIMANGYLQDLLGYSQVELEQLSFEAITHPDDRERSLANYVRLMEGEVPRYELEKRYVSKAGRTVWTRLVMANTTGQERPEFVLATIRDISREKELEAQLSDTRNHCQTIGAHMADQVCILQPDGTYQWVGDSVIRFYGYRPEELMGRSPLKFVHPEDALLLQEGEHQQVLDGAYLEEYRTELRFRQKDGQYAWVETYFRPIYNEDQQLQRILTNTRKIEARKRAHLECRSMLERLKRRNRELQEYVFVTSHYLRTPITNILGLLNLYLESPEPGNILNTVNDKIIASTGKLEAVLQDLHQVILMKRQGPRTRERVNLRALVAEVQWTLSDLLHSRKGMVRLNFPAHVVIETFPPYLFSILQNLLTNALQYSHPDRDPRITISARERGAFVEIVIADNGVGIDLERHRDHVFQIYRHFHQDPQGKGIGLYMVRVQSEELGGSVSVDSEPGVGTRFTLRFPV